MWFRASAAAVLLTALLLPIGHARADGSLITTAVQVSLKIQQSCQIDSADASGAAVAGAATSDAQATLAGASPSSTTPSSGATGATGTATLASAGTGAGADVAPKVSCQFDEPYGVLSSTAFDATTRALTGEAVAGEGTIQVASWTVLF
ncbi:hypothetical protein [Robbsia sp. KACC 23696]|uniref:hypothetical protein n=1 Tax=Robbsia sp. KACC 23696 TaxID=3149231 RepID=UPI00325C27BB